MAELPEVRAMTTVIKPKLELFSIRSVRVNNSSLLVDGNARNFRTALMNKVITKVSSYGKRLIIELNDNTKIIVFFALTGELDITNEYPRYADVVIGLCNGSYISIVDRRGMAQIFVSPGTADAKATAPSFMTERFWKVLNAVATTVGPEATGHDFDAAYLYKKASRRHISIKTLLCDQNEISGIGNTYADEILFDAHMNPSRYCDTLSLKDCEVLVTSVKNVLGKFITMCDNFADEDFRLSVIESKSHKNTLIHGKAKCPVCHSTTKYIRLAGRGTYFCPVCQGDCE